MSAHLFKINDDLIVLKELESKLFDPQNMYKTDDWNPIASTESYLRWLTGCSLALIWLTNIVVFIGSGEWLVSRIRGTYVCNI